METPYRNQHRFEDVLASCSPETYLSISCHLMSEEQWIKTQQIHQWQKEKIILPKMPVIFLIYKKNHKRRE
jgi:16S rRNA (cytidine1402-2'-O)-methyltransferase